METRSLIVLASITLFIAGHASGLIPDGGLYVLAGLVTVLYTLIVGAATFMLFTVDRKLDGLIKEKHYEHVSALVISAANSLKVTHRVKLAAIPTFVIWYIYTNMMMVWFWVPIGLFLSYQLLVIIVSIRIRNWVRGYQLQLNILHAIEDAVNNHRNSRQQDTDDIS